MPARKKKDAGEVSGEPPRVLVCGSRTWEDGEAIYKALAKMPPGTTVIHGAARGADRLAGMVARTLGFDVLEYPAQWSKHGKAAGPIRNEQMLREGRPTLVLAFRRNESRGTTHMMMLAAEAGVPVRVLEKP